MSNLRIETLTLQDHWHIAQLLNNDGTHEHEMARGGGVTPAIATANLRANIERQLEFWTEAKEAAK